MGHKGIKQEYIDRCHAIESALGLKKGECDRTYFEEIDHIRTERLAIPLDILEKLIEDSKSHARLLTERDQARSDADNLASSVLRILVTPVIDDPEDGSVQPLDGLIDAVQTYADRQGWKGPAGSFVKSGRIDVSKTIKEKKDLQPSTH